MSEGSYRGLIDEDKEQLKQRMPKAPLDDPADDNSIDLALTMKSDLGKYAESQH